MIAKKAACIVAISTGSLLRLSMPVKISGRQLVRWLDDSLVMTASLPHLTGPQLRIWTIVGAEVMSCLVTARRIVVVSSPAVPDNYSPKYNNCLDISIRAAQSPALLL